MHHRVAWLIWVVPAAVVISGCAPQSPPPPRNVLLVSIDTLRADRLGAGIAPALDRLAAAGVQFVSARTPVPLTLPAHASLLTGALPAAHGVHVNGQVLPADVPTLATVLRAAGYRTGGFVGAYVLDRRFGLARGFDTYDDRVPRNPEASDRLEAERPANQVVDAALAWLDAAPSSPSAPFFLWVHLYDPHAPYTPPPGAPGVPGRGPYDAEVAYAGAQAGRLFERLEARGLTGSTVIVLAGDHGEGLGEHGEQTHGMLAYDATLRVPLVVAAPGEAARRIAAPVSLTDVAPAVLKLAGVTGTLVAGASTRDLFAAADGGEVYAETEYPAAAGWSPLSVLASARWKLIRASTPELYDLRADPAEAINLAAANRREVQAMAGRLGAARGTERLRASAAAAPDAEARLRALGYVGGATPTATSDAAPNPAAEIAAWGRFEQALSALARGDHAAALPIARELAARFPAGPVFQSTYARALLDAGQPARGGCGAAFSGRAPARRPVAVPRSLGGGSRGRRHRRGAARGAGRPGARRVQPAGAQRRRPAARRGRPQPRGGRGVRAGHGRRSVERHLLVQPRQRPAGPRGGGAPPRPPIGARSRCSRPTPTPPTASGCCWCNAATPRRRCRGSSGPWPPPPPSTRPVSTWASPTRRAASRRRPAAAYQQVLREAPRHATRERAAAADLLRTLR